MLERLQKIIARAGIASRRKAEELIRQGMVTVNGRVVTELGTRADPDKDHIKVSGKRIQPERLEYFAVNKPRSVLSAVSDERRRRLVIDLVPSGARLFPAGRLDFDSEGLVILTNDGDLAKRIMKAGHWEKKYRVKVHGRPSERKLKLLSEGLRVKRERFAPCRIRPLKIGDNCWFEVVLKQGRNRQIRRMFDAVGHSVMRLRRVAVGPVQLGDLPPGGFRRLTEREIEALRN